MHSLPDPAAPIAIASSLPCIDRSSRALHPARTVDVFPIGHEFID